MFCSHHGWISTSKQIPCTYVSPAIYQGVQNKKKSKIIIQLSKLAIQLHQQAFKILNSKKKNDFAINFDETKNEQPKVHKVHLSSRNNFYRANQLKDFQKRCD